MSTTNPSQLFLLADHIKLSLLERQRAISLNLSPNSQDGQISRSLDALRSGIEALNAQLDQSPDESLQDQLPRLRSQLTDLTTQFASNGTNFSTTLTTPNNPSLSPDFAAAQRPRPQKPARSPQRQTSKSVRFTDTAIDVEAQDPNRAALFPYRDDPADVGPPDQSDLDNQQIHAYHSQVLREQDTQLDRLGESIGRQRELSMQIGDELDGQVLLLDEIDEGVDRHQGQFNRARGRLERVSRKARENWSLTVIVVLIVILVLLIVILK
ncbi:hypothetical protein K432DRAFT_441445 [Lepidopterella palustris CBS 459.81]|uniref:t-SNARE coiled-coil homology domain-containing protein n=1 Tax=Lepidopterella palustris CBS 459.81 TaxID=1314670 RepID=A0A8E2JHY3_9PEZI|nr:hypothetical protein K432DRAFT_441445 [Lepidopterella palustris CBS 459.81]